MSHTPIDKLLDSVQWEEVQREACEAAPSTDDLPYITHRGILNFCGHDLECFVLSDGMRIFTEESILKLFGITP